jgi:hypothetical protein
MKKSIRRFKQLLTKCSILNITCCFDSTKQLWSVPNIVSSKSRTVQYRVPRCPSQYRNVQYRVPRCPSQYRNVQYRKSGSICIFDNSSVDRSRRSLFLYIDFYLYFHYFDLHLLFTKVIMQIKTTISGIDLHWNYQKHISIHFWVIY